MIRTRRNGGSGASTAVVLMVMGETRKEEMQSSEERHSALETSFYRFGNKDGGILSNHSEMILEIITLS